MFFVQLQQVIITAKNVVEFFNYCAFFFGNGGKPLANVGFVFEGELKVLGEEINGQLFCIGSVVCVFGMFLQITTCGY
jgi:hypothetical protein